MSNEISYVAKSDGKLAKNVLFGLIGSSIIFIAAANNAPKLSGLLWMVAFSFIVASIYVYTRYVGAEYCYSIVDYGTPSLVVTQKVGRTVKTMARIDIDSITEVRYLSRKEIKAYVPRKGVVRYSYHPTMCPSGIYLVRMHSFGEDADLFIEVSNDFAAELSARSNSR